MKAPITSMCLVAAVAPGHGAKITVEMLLAEAKALAGEEQATFALGKTRFNLAFAQVR